MEAPLVTGGGGLSGANIHRISSACDSGYSELDIYSNGPPQEVTRGKETSGDVTRGEEEGALDISYMDELQLYFNLDKMFDKASHEEKCFRELDLSICSEESKDGSCSEYSCAVPSNTAKLFYHHQSSVDSFASANSNSLTTNNKAVISLAQLFSTNTIKNLNEHNVSKKYLESIHSKQHFKVKESDAVLISDEQHTQAKISRENSSRSLPITSREEDKSGEEDSDEDTTSDLRRPSLPKVTQLGKDAVILAEQSQKSREIFI